jgi:thiol-disulfide isomerase/thioredoxin
MGRLPTLSLALCLALPLSACDTVSQKDAPMATNERSQAITQKGPVTPSTPATLPVKASEPAAPKKPRSLCAGKLADAGRSLPKKHVSRAAAKGVPELPESLTIGSGKWTWINFWAAWCAPCKEEIPRLLSFEQKLGASGAAFRLAFVSLDDDERQLRDFLLQQPAAGLKSSYWLPDGATRQAWLDALSLKAEPELPLQLLLDPSGRIRCRVQGAVEPQDLAALERIIRG